MGAERDPPTRAPWALGRVGALTRVGDVALAPALGRDAPPPTRADGLVRPEVVALADGFARPELVARADGLVRPEVVALADGVARPPFVARDEGFTLAPEALLPTDPGADPRADLVRTWSDGRVVPEVRTPVRDGAAVRPGATALLPLVAVPFTPRDDTARPLTPARLVAREGLAAAARVVELALACGAPDRLGRVCEAASIDPRRVSGLSLKRAEA